MAEQKTLVLTGASRGIGHATVKRFSSEGWRVLTCSRQPFDPRCPWPGGEENHIQIDLADPNKTIAGLEVIEHCVRVRSSTKITVCTLFDDDEHLFESLKAGALGYVLKDYIDSHLVTSVLELMQGGAPMSPKIARRVVADTL